MPPIAPAWETNGGIRIKMPGIASSSVRCASSTAPAKMSRIGARALTPAISINVRCTSRELRTTAQSRAARAASAQAPATMAFAASLRAMKVARKSAGNVTMSPIAVTIGVETASRSHPRRNDCTDSITVTTRITAEASTPPTTEMVTRSQNEMVSSPNAEATSLAMPAR